ncbi:MAG TPA: non-homologous end-joining DNA ligase, partial [Vicinamibacterales bacterium]|nr:non-homologous end-joining DNA ligase [Vicinamibacterales bacterium]
MPARLAPMLATLSDPPLTDPKLAYEPKYDGIRAIVEIGTSGGAGAVRIFSRAGNDKTRQFPEIARALSEYGRGLKAGVVLDGEIVALGVDGEPTGFQQLQGRIHLTLDADVRRASSRAPVAFIAFDILRDNGEDLRALPLTSRRARLERVFGNTGSPLLRLSTFVPADGRALYREAAARGWEGLVAKHLESHYKSGQRSPDWRKLKITRQQEFVVGGWTEPRNTRGYLGALLLGVYDEDGRLEYVGHTGTGFSGAELERVWRLLEPLETPRPPFTTRPHSNERPHWVEPQLVAQVRFTEWTSDGKLRHPVYLGMRDDVEPRSVRREPGAGEARAVKTTSAPRRVKATGTAAGRSASKGTARSKGTAVRSKGTAKAGSARAGATEGLRPLARGMEGRRATALVARLQEIEARGGDGRIEPGEGLTLDVGNLGKVFWPGLKLTKGDLMRYYVDVAAYLLPVLDDRPLVMKRFPNGVRGKAFYQQRAPDPIPPGVRVETLPDDAEVPSRLVGGSLATLLYMTQLAAISQDPWFSRVGSPLHCDHVAIDLDPMPGITFEQILDAARWVHDELEAHGIPGFPKTSGADGLHIYIPMPPATPYETALLF